MSTEFGTYPFTGNLDALHSQRPGIDKIANFLSALSSSMTVKSWDQTTPLTCSGAMTSTGDVIEWARYYTLEPLAKLCFIDIKVSNMTLGGVASSGIYVKLPVSGGVPIRVVLYGQCEGVATVGLIASAVSAADPQYVLARRTDAAAFALGATTTIRLTGWYDYS